VLFGTKVADEYETSNSVVRLRLHVGNSANLA
jgi:hypothetical protein